ncbi:uncharacterized protein [Asterias amurensis]|uniref:uncharacterized protein n=1 Tax=Asterias amurensis TaxID=7602 RepID=UPI003AB55C3A
MRRTTSDQPPPSPTDSSPPPSPTDPQKELPDWFELRPFQYDGRVFITALPGMFLALALSGELLLGVVVIGGLLIHFMHSGGAKRRAVLVYLCVFIAAQMTIIYSALPLLWESFYNIITILLLNMSIVMTGGWILVHFEEFLKEEPTLAEALEMSLFTIFPSVSVAVTCCMLTMLASPSYIPYSVIIHGFLILRLFVTPTSPSFRKPNYKSFTSSGAFVLGHVEVSLLLILYVSTPAEVFIFMNILNLFELISVLRLLFLIFTPCFLMTLLELRAWTEGYGIHYKYIIMIRWISGITALLLGSILMKYTHVSFMVDWLSVTVLTNVLLGWTASQKGHVQQMFKLIFGVAVGLIYTLAVYYSIPRHLELQDLDLTWITYGLISIAVLSVACFLVSSSQNQKLSSALLIAFMGGLVYAESLLYQHQLYSSFLLLCTSVCSVYLFVRLLSAGVVTWYCAWIGSALHAFKAPYLVEVLAGVNQSPITGSFSIVALTLTVTKLFCFEQQGDLSIRAASMYILSVTVGIILSYHSLLQPLCYILYDSTPTSLQAACFVNIISTLLSLKITTQHLRHLPSARKINILWIMTTCLIFVIQPSSSVSQYNLSSWLTITACTLGSAIFLRIASFQLGPFLVFILSCIFGLASGLKVSLMLCTTASNLTILQYTLSCTACSFVMLTLLINFQSSRPLQKQFILKPSVCFLAIVALMTYITEANQALKDNGKDLKMPCLQLYCIISMLLVFALRAHCFFIKKRDPFGSSPNQEALICNLLTISAYLLACMNCPIEQWEIWNSVSSLILLSLQRDPTVFVNLTTRSTSGVVVGVSLLNVFSAAVMQSDLWQVGVGFVAILEIGLFLLTFPVLSTFVQYQLINDHNIKVQLLVFLTPLNVLFFLVGSSYTSWLLAGIGLSAGFGMISTKFSFTEGI